VTCYVSCILQPFNGLFSRITWLSRYQKGRPILHFNEATDDGVTVASAEPYANNLHFAPAPHDSILLFLMLNGYIVV